MAKSQSTLSVKLAAASAAMLLAASLHSAGVHGQSVEGEVIVPDTIQLPMRFVKRLTNEQDHDKRLLTALQQFERIDLDGNGVSQEDLDRRNQMEAAQIRSGTIKRYMASDLNADGVVSRKEMENVVIWKNRRRLPRNGSRTSAKLRLKQYMKKELEPFEKADLDGNDELTASELLGLAKSLADAQREARSKRQRHTLEGSIMSLDFNADGVVSEREFIAAISSLAPESALAQKPKNTVRVVEPGCVVPQVQSDERLVFVASHTGSVPSNVTILGQDKMTWAVDVVVKAGKAPLYVVLTSYDPIIWKFKGATSRVRHVVLKSRSGLDDAVVGSGLTGVDRAKVSFVTGQNCLGVFYGTGITQKTRAKARIRDVVGREPDYLLGHRVVAMVALPDGPAFKVIRDNRPRVRVGSGSEKQAVLPPGSRKIDAARVVSQKPASNYEVLPRQAGLAQLQVEGKIGRVEHKTYRIKQKIHIPPGLTRGHRAKFLLPKGVPEPDGDLGDSCLFSEAAGRYIGRSLSRCR